ncbi:hypothetical protein Taro_005742 [Colocasia esculenta]|uniref:Uncharacterized protein n=1 Tax=Colocasia esculenta TaxID=4460 RepID=A0A843TP14_COLES|nr:hypothetical protein [Colocasia esculenta]
MLAEWAHEVDFEIAVLEYSGQKLVVGFEVEVVVYTPELDGIAGSDRIQEGCFLGLLRFDLVTDQSPSFDIHQQFETLSLPNFVENFEFEFDIEFVVLAQFGIESPSCFGVGSFYHPNWVKEVVVDSMKVEPNLNSGSVYQACTDEKPSIYDF